MKAINLIELTIDDFRKILEEVLETNTKGQGKSPQNPLVEYFTRNEAAKLLRISLPTLSRYSKLGLVKEYRIGTRILFKKSEVDSCLEQVQTSKYIRS